MYAKYLGRFKFYKFYFRGPYLLFVKETLPSIPSSSETDHTESIKNTDIFKQIGVKWHALTAAEKQVCAQFMFPTDWLWLFRYLSFFYYSLCSFSRGQVGGSCSTYWSRVGYCWNPSIQSPVGASDVLVLTTSVPLEIHYTSTYMYLDWVDYPHVDLWQSFIRVEETAQEWSDAIHGQSWRQRSTGKVCANNYADPSFSCMYSVRNNFYWLYGQMSHWPDTCRNAWSF